MRFRQQLLRHLGVLCTTFALASVSLSSYAQQLSAIDAAKTTEEIIKNARNGIAQDLWVSLAGESVQKRVEERLKERGLEPESPQKIEELRMGNQALRAEVFPNDQLGEAVVVEHSKFFPLLKVRVPNFAALAKILGDPRVTAVRGNDKVYPHLSQSLPLIGQPAAVNIQRKTGLGYRVAILDSGADYRQSNFNTCRIRGDAWRTGPYIGDPGCRISNAFEYVYSTPFFDVDAGGHHGTIVSAIAAKTAPGVKLDIFNIFQLVNGRLESNFDAVRRALEWVIVSAPTAPRIVAVNMSFGGGTTFVSECRNTNYQVLFANLRAVGVIPVVSTGNDASPTGVAEPACVPGALRVGAVWDQDYPSDQLWPGGCRDTNPRVDSVPCSSNSGALTQLLAPGANISIGAFGAAGTSMAAPHVTGAIAILKEAFPSDSVDGTIARMTGSGKTVRDSKNNLLRPRLNISAALSTGSMGDGGLPVKILTAAILPLVMH